MDWNRLHMRDFGDLAYTFEALKNEMIRHHFFHRVIDEKAVRHAQRKGRSLLKGAARDRLTKYLAPAEPIRDGRLFRDNQDENACCLIQECSRVWTALPHPNAPHGS